MIYIILALAFVEIHVGSSPTPRNLLLSILINTDQSYLKNYFSTTKLNIHIKLQPKSEHQWGTYIKLQTP